MPRSLLIAFLLAASLSASAQPYSDVTAHAGLAVILRATGMAAADIDLDGDVDLYVVSPEERDETDPTTWNHLFRNRGDGTFEEITTGSGIEPFDGGYRRGQQGNRFGAAWGDYDGDRLPDLFLARIGPERLYRNRGDGTFEDVTVRAGVFGTNDTSNDVAGSWADLDGDGDLDLYVSAWIGPNRLYMNQGDGSFTEEAADRGLVDGGFSWGALPMDVDEDGLTDLYVINDFGPNRLYLQQADGTYLEDTATWGLQDEGNGMGVAQADINRDGKADVFVTNIADRFPNPLFLRESSSFVERAESYGLADTGWAWGVEFFDADNDADQDFYTVTGFPTDPSNNRFLEARQLLSGEVLYVDQSERTGTDSRAEARALTVFDPDSDGTLDLLIGNFRSQSVLLKRTSAPGNWVGFWLDGPAENRWGVGSEVTVSAGGRVQSRYMDGIDFLGQSILPAHFGLAGETRVDQVSVRWPDGTEDHWLGIDPGHYHTLRYGGSQSTTVEPDSPVPGHSAAPPFPNPATGRVRFQVAGAITIFDVLGRRLGTRHARSGVLDISDLPAGPVFLVTPAGQAHPLVIQHH